MPPAPPAPPPTPPHILIITGGTSNPSDEPEYTVYLSHLIPMGIIFSGDHILDPACTVAFVPASDGGCQNADALLAGPHADGLQVDATKLDDEWARFRAGPLKQKKDSNLGYRAFVKEILNSPEAVQAYPELAKLLRITIILPLGNAICERGFSAQNFIKS